MRILFLVSLLVLVTVSALGQTVPRGFIRALSPTGEPVLLSPDGTWSRVVAPAGAPSWNKLGEIRTVTLLSRSEHKDWETATFSFLHGMREDPTRLGRNIRDLLFDNGGDPDMFDVPQQQPNDASRLLDLGRLEWSEMKVVPKLSANTEFTRQPRVPAVVGHTYVLHTKRADADLYTLFRVDNLQSRDTCTISWIVVPSPEYESPADGMLARTYSGQLVSIEPDGKWNPEIEPTDGRWKGVAIQTTRLFSLIRYDDLHRAGVGFTQDPADNRGQKRDFVFGNSDDHFLTTGSFSVQTRLKKLGAMTWSELRSFSPLQEYDEPIERKYGELLKGHMYQLWIKRGNIDLHAIFRAEWLEPGNTCVITWIVLPRPVLPVSGIPGGLIAGGQLGDAQEKKRQVWQYFGYNKSPAEYYGVFQEELTKRGNDGWSIAYIDFTRDPERVLVRLKRPVGAPVVAWEFTVFDLFSDADWDRKAAEGWQFCAQQRVERPSLGRFTAQRPKLTP